MTAAVASLIGLRAHMSRAHSGGGEWPDGPVFTVDWLTHVVEVWDAHLGAFRGRPGVRFLEVGSYEGGSAVWLCRNILTGVGSTLTCVDPFDVRWEGRFDHNIAASGVADRVVKLKGRSQDVVRALPRVETFDFVYVDGCHHPECVLADSVLCFDLLKVGGLIMWDDYEFVDPPDQPGEAVDAFLVVYRRHLDVVHRDYSVLARKTSPAYPW